MLRDESDLEIVAFPAESAVWCARPGHPLAGRQGISADEFFAYPFAGPALPGWVDTWFQRQSGARPEAPFRFAVTCSHYPSLKIILRETDCVSGAIQSILGQDFADGSLVPLDVTLPPLTMQAGLVWLRHRILSPAARALVASIKRRVEKLAVDQPRSAAARQSRAPRRKSGTSSRK
jgi:DNA-binding transcriptional LysR family regulator